MAEPAVYSQGVWVEAGPPAGQGQQVTWQARVRVFLLKCSKPCSSSPQPEGPPAVFVQGLLSLETSGDVATRVVQSTALVVCRFCGP